jgi:hypothetical protein
MVRVQQVRVLPKRDATFRINVEDAHDFHAYRFAGDLTIVDSLGQDGASTRCERLDVDRGVRNQLQLRLQFRSDGVDAPVDASWTVDVYRVVIKEADHLVYIRRRKAGQEIPDRRLC